MNRGQGDGQMQKTLHAEHTGTPLIAKRRPRWWVVVARTAYVVLTGSAIFLFIFSLPVYYAQMQIVCPTLPGCSFAGQLSQGTLPWFQSVHLSVSAYAASLLAIATVQAVLALIIGVVIVWRLWGKSNEVLGLHAQSLHERFFRTLHLPYLQLDELCTRLRSSTQVLWLWLAIDPLTKILPVLELGPRTQHMAHQLIHSLRQLLAPGCIPLFTSDGLNVYFYALTAHFGQWQEVGRHGRKALRWLVATGLIYGQVKKSYRRRRLIRVSQVMRLGTKDALTVALQGLGFSGRLNTAFIERVNLTVRHAIAALARRTWATSQQASQLLAHLEWWRAYYHFVRPHQSLQVALVQPPERGGKLAAQRYRQRTPAMAAGRTTRRWAARDVLSYPLPPVAA